MVFILGIIAGLVIMFFLKDLVLIGPIIAGLVAGAISKGPVAGLFAGLIVALVGATLFSLSSITALQFVSGVNISQITGFSIQEVNPIDTLKTIFSISGVLAATIAGCIGGLIRR